MSPNMGQFKKKKRYNLRAMVRQLQDAGGELVTSSDTRTHQEFLEALFLLHRRRPKERKLESSFEGPHVEVLHRRLVLESASARFYGIRLNHQMVAVIYAFERSDRFFYYQIAHDPDYGTLSPGSALLFLVLEDYCAGGGMACVAA